MRKSWGAGPEDVAAVNQVSHHAGAESLVGHEVLEAGLALERLALVLC